jgi:glycosyltransferase involved in cell wall biosynthesis
MGSEAIAKPAGVTFIMVSRLFHPKDHTTLLRAFAELRRTRSDATLWIVGDGELRSALEETARGLGIDGAVRFWGDCRNPGAFLHAADVFVLSSRSEGLPISLLEAMAAGLPAVVTDVGGMAEVIRHSDTGSRVPPADAGALAAALESWAADAERRRETGRRARQYFETHFTLEIMADLYLRLYRREPLPVSPFAAARSPQARPADAGS